jgi:hypothetical protein
MPRAKSNSQRPILEVVRQKIRQLNPRVSIASLIANTRTSGRGNLEKSPSRRSEVVLLSSIARRFPAKNQGGGRRFNSRIRCHRRLSRSLQAATTGAKGLVPDPRARLGPSHYTAEDALGGAEGGKVRHG